MSNDSLRTWSPLNGAGEENGIDDGTDDIFSWKLIKEIISAIVLIVISTFGLMGNGTVIWFLGFCMKKNRFTTFILNLAAADLGTLICLFTFSIIQLLKSIPSLTTYFYYSYYLCLTVGLFLFLFIYNTGQYLLTAISIDRCVSVVFPLWHRCHRPPYFSTLVCALIWIISFLLTVIGMIPVNFHITYYHLLMNAILCLPLMTVSTLVLFIKVYFRSKQRKKGKAVTAILLALLFFLFLAFPFTFILLMGLFPIFVKDTDIFLGLLCSCLNSSVNPLIYFLVGRKKHSRSRESLKVIFQRVFKEEEDCRKKQDVQVQTRI